MIQSVDRALIILEMLKGAPRGKGVTEISKELNVAKSTVHRLLITMEKHGYVRNIQHDGMYSLGLKFIEMSQLVLEDMDIVELAHPLLEELTADLEEITHLVMLDRHEIVYIDKVESQSTIRIYSRTGRRAPLYCTGVGKAVAAYFSEAELETYLNEVEMEAHTPQTITTAEDFKTEMMKIRQLGYAMDDEEHEAGIRCVAAPVFNHKGEVEYAISTTGPVNRLGDKRLESLIPVVQETALKVSKAIGYRGTTVSQNEETKNMKNKKEEE